MFEHPELSVIIPVYNGADFLKNTIESVLEKSRNFSVECIVVNDGSTDRTAEVIEAFEGQIRSIWQENGGEGSAVNLGVRAAHGDYILVVSADDPILTEKIFDGVGNFFENRPQVVAWYPDWNIIDVNGKVIKTIRLPNYSFKDLFCKNMVLPGPGTWFRASAARAIGGRNPNWRFVGDYDFWLRLSQEGLFEHREQLLAQWRKHSNSTSISHRGALMAKERVEVIEQFINQFKTSLLPSQMSLARAHAHYLAARLGFFSSSVNSRGLSIRALKLDLRVFGSIKPHEFIFMLGFPLTKFLTDKLIKFRVN